MSEGKIPRPSGRWHTPRRANSCGRRPVSSTSSTTTRPDRGRTIPVAVRSTVVLPAPFGPSSATTSPRATERLTSRSTIESPYPASSARAAGRDHHAVGGVCAVERQRRHAGSSPVPRRRGTRPGPRRSAPSPRACPRRSVCRSRARRPGCTRSARASCRARRAGCRTLVRATTSSSTCPKRSVSCPSSPDDGSSSSSRSKGPASVRASSTSRRWPIGNSPAWMSATRLVPVSASASSVAVSMARVEATGAHDLRQRVPPRHRSLAAHRDVLPHREVAEELGALEGAPQPAAGPLGGAVTADVVPVQQDASSARFEQTAARVERRRLARAVRPDESGDRAHRRLEVHVVDRGDAAETHREIAHLEAGRRRCAHRRRGRDD